MSGLKKPNDVSDLDLKKYLVKTMVFGKLEEQKKEKDSYRGSV